MASALTAVSAALVGADCGGISAAPLAEDGGASADAGLDSGSEVRTETCALGMPCNPVGNVCQKGTTSCASGKEACVDLVNASQGTACGTNQVCDQGVCIACASGLSCNPSDNACQAGITSCSSGMPTCVAMGNAANGTSCGANNVCFDGACTSCVAGAACTLPGNPCQTGATSCSSGQSTCVVTGDVPDGTACPTGICCGGTCAACSSPPAHQVVTCSVTTCTFACQSGYSMCGGTDCIDTTSNSNACGPSCMVCPSGTSCTNSKCGTVEYGYPTEFSPCGGSFSGVSSDYLFGESITIPATITVTALGLFGNNPAAGVHGVMALYGDSGGAPSGLKTDTSSTAIANGNNLIPVLSQVSVGPGTYWIFAEFDSLAAICSDSSTSNQWDYIPVTYGSAPNLFGTPMTTAGQANLNYYVVGTL